jgi:Serine hydrolase
MQIHEESAASLETPLADASVLVIPGWNGSGAGHWQTLWEQKYPGFRRVVQHNWTRPSRETAWAAWPLRTGPRQPGRRRITWKAHSWLRRLGLRKRSVSGAVGRFSSHACVPSSVPFPSGGERRRPLLADRDRRAPGLGVGLPIRGRRAAGAYIFAPHVTYELLRAVSPLLATPSQQRSPECERGRQECARHSRPPKSRWTRTPLTL